MDSGEARFATFALVLGVVGFMSALGWMCSLFCGALGSTACAPEFSMGWIVLFVGFSGGGVDDVCVLGSDGLGLMVADFTGGLTEAVGAGVAMISAAAVVIVVTAVVLEWLSLCRRVCTAYHAAATKIICMAALSSTIRHQRLLEMRWTLAFGVGG